jgi:uncharacterized Zn-binding protein involved in type VI secretion
MSAVVLTLQQTVQATVAHETAPLPDPAKNPARTVAAAAGKIASALSLPLDLANAGVAAATNFIADILPKFPAARLTSLYVGAPHAHAHPPSLIPPAPPVPLPSIGTVLLGTCVQVLVGGLPAARAGDIGLAPTCVGFAPFFTVFLGSSKVLIGGTRAARMTDICTACTPSKDGAMRATAAAMSKASKAVAVAQMAAGAAMAVAGSAAIVAGVAGAAADAIDAASEPDPYLASAQALSAGMAIAQLAADAVAMAATTAMGTDPAIPPFLPGALLTGAPNVLVAGMPLPNIPDPAQWLMKKLKMKLRRKKNQNKKKKGGGGGCPG